MFPNNQPLHIINTSNLASRTEATDIDSHFILHNTVRDNFKQQDNSHFQFL